MSDLLEALEVERQEMVTRASELLATVETRGDEMTMAERAEFDATKKAIATTDRRVEQIRSDAKSKAEAAELKDRLERSGYFNNKDTDGGAQGNAGDMAVRSVISGETRGVNLSFETRDIIMTSENNNGFTGSRPFGEQVVTAVYESSPLLMAGPTVISTQDGNELRLPSLTDRGTSAITDEGSQIGEAGTALGDVRLGAFHFARIDKVSNQLLEDSSVDIGALLGPNAGAEIASKMEEHAITGTGVDEPEGLVTATSVGVTTASADAITSDEILALQHSVKGPHRRSANAAYFLSTDAFQHVRNLRDNQDRFLFSIDDNGDERLLGRRLFEEPNLDDLAADGVVGLFGDFSKVYLRLVGQIRFERSEEAGFDTYSTSFRTSLRADSKLADRTAIRQLKMAAA